MLKNMAQIVTAVLNDTMTHTQPLPGNYREVRSYRTALLNNGCVNNGLGYAVALTITHVTMERTVGR
jgi:hypothetical protein